MAGSGDRFHIDAAIFCKFYLPFHSSSCVYLQTGMLCGLVYACAHANVLVYFSSFVSGGGGIPDRGSLWKWAEQ